MGEQDAQGWISWLKEDEDAKRRDASSSVISIVSNASVDNRPGVELDGYQRWVEAERKLDAQGWLPLPDDDHEDPYSTVLFTDIRPLLFPSPKYNNIDEAMDETALYVFLQFLGLHIPGLSDFLLPPRSEDFEEGIDSTWSYTAVCRSDDTLSDLFSLPNSSSTSSKASASLSLSKPSMASAPMDTPSSSHALVRSPEAWNSFNGVAIGPERRMGSGWGPIKEWTLGTRAPLEGHGGPGSRCGDGRMWEKSDLKDIDVNFVRCVLFFCISRGRHRFVSSHLGMVGGYSNRLTLA
jgi:hypothetical protein